MGWCRGQVGVGDVGRKVVGPMQSAELPGGGSGGEGARGMGDR